MNTSIEAVLNTSKTLSNGQHPLMLRLTKNRKRKYISLHTSLSPEHWIFEKCKSPHNNKKRRCMAFCETPPFIIIRWQVNH